MPPKIAHNYNDHSDSDSEGIDYSDSEVESTPRRRNKGIQKESGLIKGALQPYIPAQYSTTHLHQLLELGDIDLDPEYQRDVVWPESKQVGLIDSLMKNYFVPPVLFAVKDSGESDDGRQKRICVDGKQRLTSIYLFMNGQIPWKPTTGEGKGQKYWYRFIKSTHRGGKPLPEREKAAFGLKMIQCAEFHGVPEDYERDLFQRVQMGMVLSSAEKLQAISSPYVSWISTLVRNYVLDPEQGIVAYYPKWDQSRGKVFTNTCMVAMMVTGYPKDKRCTFSGKELTPWLRRVDIPEQSMRKKLDRVFETYIAIVRDYPDTAFGIIANKLAPIEWAFTGVVIHVLQNYYTIEDLAKIIGKMRVDLRAAHTEPRVRGDIVLWLWNWLGQQPKPHASKRVKEEAEDDGDEDEDEDDDDEEEEHGGAGKKRRRSESDDGDGDFYGPGLEPGSAQKKKTRSGI